MKIISRILSAVLAMSMLFGTVTLAATYKDVAQDKNYYSAVSLLSALDIIKGYEDGTFGPEKNVTRAEFAVMLIRTLGLSGVGNSDPAGLTFKDLGTVAWAVSDIRTAYDLGIINGMSAEQFAPDSQVTYEQAIKMIVCALGYEPVALDRVGGDKALIYPDGYLAVATQNNIDGGVSVVKGQPAKRWEIAKLIFNSLEIDLMEKSLAIGSDQYVIRKGKTILSDKLRIRTSTGELKADEKTSISTNGQVSKAGEVVITEQGTIDEEIFLKGTITTDGMVGRSIKYYFREDNNGIKTLAYLESKTKDSAILKINASNIDDVTGTLADGFTIKYWENKETDRSPKEEKLIGNSSVVINGRTASNVTKEDLMPLSGEIELMSTSSNGTYDKIFVTSYETYVVKTKLEKTIVDQYRNTAQDNTIEIDEDSNDYTLTMVKTDKTATTFSSITTWNVLSIKKTKNTREIIVSNSAPINGTITELDKDNGKIKIGNTDKLYEFSNYFKKYNSKGITEMNVDDSGKFYLDKDGRIAAFDKSASRGNNFGYLDKAVIENNDEFKFRILLQTNSTMGSAVTGANKIKLNGEASAENNDKIIALEPQLVKYSLNASNQIDGIVTQTTEATTDDTKLIPSIAKGSFKYNSSTKQFTQVKEAGDSTPVEKFMIDTATLVFVVPEASDVDSKYSKKNYSYFKNDSSYILEAFNASGSLKISKAVVVYGEDSSSVVSAETPIAIISKIVGATNPDGDSVQKVTAYFYGKYDTGATKEIWTESATTLSGYVVGDVIRFGTTAEGYIKNDTVQDVLKVANGVQGKYNELRDTSGNTIYIADGLLYAAGGTGTAQTFVISKTNDVNACNTAEQNTFSTNSSTAYFVYDSTLSSDTKFSKNSATDPLELSTKNYYNAEGIETPKASQIFVYALSNSVKVVYYIK